MDAVESRGEGVMHGPESAAVETDWWGRPTSLMRTTGGLAGRLSRGLFWSHLYSIILIELCV